MKNVMILFCLLLLVGLTTVVQALPSKCLQVEEKQKTCPHIMYKKAALSVAFLDVEKGNPKKRLHKKEYLISPGKPGSLDADGVMPTAFHGNYLYYIGWTLRKDVPYFNYTCVAQKVSEAYVKLG